jgi:hypothetical protein
MAVWEGSLGRPGWERALLLLEQACPGATVDDLAAWSIGRRDAALFRLRAMLFGDRFESVTRCPACTAEAELTFTLGGIWQPDERVATEDGVLRAGDYEIRFRAPDSSALAALQRQSGMEDGRRLLLQRAIVAIEPAANGDLPGPVWDAVADAIAAADPVGDRRLWVVCHACGHGWEEIFDIAVWLTGEMTTWVRRIVGEVHALASAYGWAEKEILAMTPTRRQLYLNLLAQA